MQYMCLYVYICVCIIYMLCALYYAAKFAKKVVFLKIKEINGENDVDICNKMRTSNNVTRKIRALSFIKIHWRVNPAVPVAPVALKLNFSQNSGRLRIP